MNFFIKNIFSLVFFFFNIIILLKSKKKKKIIKLKHHPKINFHYINLYVCKINRYKERKKGKSICIIFKKQNIFQNRFSCRKLPFATEFSHRC